MTYEEAGLASALIGLQRAYDMIGREIENVKERLAQARNGGNAREFVEERKRPVGRPAKNAERAADLERFARKSKSVKGYWANMSAEERSAEMARRIAVHQAKIAAKAVGDIGVDVNKLHPRDPRSPRHEAWRKKMRKVNKAMWANYTPEERAARVARAQAHRSAA